MLNEKVESQEEIFVLRQNELQDELSTLKRSVQSLQSEVDEKSRELAEARITAEELAAKNIGINNVYGCYSASLQSINSRRARGMMRRTH